MWTRRYKSAPSILDPLPSLKWKYGMQYRCFLFRFVSIETELACSFRFISIESNGTFVSADRCGGPRHVGRETVDVLPYPSTIRTGAAAREDSTSWTHREPQSRWPRGIKKSARTYIYQIQALEQLSTSMNVDIRHFGLQKKYGSKHVFWNSSGSIGERPRS